MGRLSPLGCHHAPRRSPGFHRSVYSNALSDSTPVSNSLSGRVAIEEDASISLLGTLDCAHSVYVRRPCLHPIPPPLQQYVFVDDTHTGLVSGHRHSCFTPPFYSPHRPVYPVSCFPVGEHGHGFASLNARAKPCEHSDRSSMSEVGSGMPESRNSGIKWNADLCNQAIDGLRPGRT